MQTKEESKEESIRVINHKRMRQYTGGIALLMPWVVVFLSGRPWADMSSISISYWTDSRDIFVGCLIAVAFFLAAYNGTGACKKDTEFWLSKVAGFSALLVALFPTTCTFQKECIDAPNWIMDISFNHPQYVHYTFAILLFFCLIVLISFFSLRAKYKRMLFRSRVYLVFSLLMLFGMPLVFVIGKLIEDWYEPIFVVEAFGLTLFGLGWLIAGSYKRKPEEPVPKGVERLDTVEVDPKQKYYPTEVVVESGVQYFFKAEGCWKDWFLECGPNGWGPDWNPLARWNRIKWKPLFMLCGNVGKSEDEDLNFCVGDKNTWSVPVEVKEKFKELEDHELYLFANDWETRYGNNEELGAKEGGPLKVTIYRLK